MHAIKKLKTFHFKFDLLKDCDKNLKHETEFIIKCSESLAGQRITNQIHQLLYKYNPGNNIHEHRKQ